MLINPVLRAMYWHTHLKICDLPTNVACFLTHQHRCILVLLGTHGRVFFARFSLPQSWHHIRVFCLPQSWRHIREDLYTAINLRAWIAKSERTRRSEECG